MLQSSCLFSIAPTNRTGFGSNTSGICRVPGEDHDSVLLNSETAADIVTAVDCIKQLKEAGSQEVVVLHVVNQRIIDGLTRLAARNSDIEIWRHKAEEIARESLADIARDLENDGFVVKTMIRTGYPSQEILDVEKNEDPSVIVLGSHGRSNLGEMLLGSVSERAIRRCHRPVIVIKRERG